MKVTLLDETKDYQIVPGPIDNALLENADKTPSVADFEFEEQEEERE